MEMLVPRGRTAGGVSRCGPRPSPRVTPSGSSSTPRTVSTTTAGTSSSVGNTRAADTASAAPPGHADEDRSPSSRVTTRERQASACTHCQLPARTPHLTGKRSNRSTPTRHHSKITPGTAKPYPPETVTAPAPHASDQDLCLATAPVRRIRLPPPGAPMHFFPADRNGAKMETILPNYRFPLDK